MFKQFWRWLKDTEEFPPEVRWIKSGYGITHKKLVDDLISSKEVKEAIQACESPRDKAFISFLYESGARIGEMLSMEIKDFWSEKFCSRARLTDKTGERVIPIVNSIPYMSAYLETHPFRDDPKAAIWLSFSRYHHHNPLLHQGATKLIKTLFDKAKIKKKCNPHTFRHSRASELSIDLKEQQMCQYFGWVIGSEQTRNFVHLSGRDLDASILRANGVEVKESKDDNPLKPMPCPRCNFTNSGAAKYCSQCSLALSFEAAKDAERTIHEATDEAMQKLMEIAKNPTLLSEFNEFRLKNR